MITPVYKVYDDIECNTLEEAMRYEAEHPITLSLKNPNKNDQIKTDDWLYGEKDLQEDVNLILDYYKNKI